MAKKSLEKSEAVAKEQVKPVDAEPAVEQSSKTFKAKNKLNGELEKPVVSSTDDTATKKSGADNKVKKAKSAQKNPDKPNIFKRMGKGIKGIISELKKVTWPKGKDVAKSTAVVLVVVIAFFVVLFGIDYVLTGLFSLVVKGEWKFIFIS